MDGSGLEELKAQLLKELKEELRSSEVVAKEVGSVPIGGATILDYIKVFAFLLIVLVILVLAGYFIYVNEFKSPPTPITATTENLTGAENNKDTRTTIAGVLNNALASVGSSKTVSESDAGELKKKVDDVKTSAPQEKWTFAGWSAKTDAEKKTQQAAVDKKVQDKATSEKRDVVWKDQTSDATWNYYGVTLDKKEMWGLYYDLKSNGGRGLTYGRYHVIVDVGANKRDNSFEARIHYVIRK